MRLIKWLVISLFGLGCGLYSIYLMIIKDYTSLAIFFGAMAFFIVIENINKTKNQREKAIESINGPSPKIIAVKDFQDGAPKTRWGLFAGILVGIVATIFVLALALGFALKTESTLSSQVAQAQPLPARYFDYMAIVDSIGAGFVTRQHTETGEVWTNTASQTTININGAPNTIYQVAMMFPLTESKADLEFNLGIIDLLSGALANDHSVLEWTASVKNEVNEARNFNNVNVDVSKKYFGNTLMWVIVFTHLKQI